MCLFIHSHKKLFEIIFKLGIAFSVIVMPPKGSVQFSCSVVSDSLRPHGLYPARLLCPWHSPGKNTGVGCHFLLQGIFRIKGSNPCLLRLLHWQADSLPLGRLGGLLKNKLSDMPQNGPSSPGDVLRGPLPSPAQTPRVSLLGPHRPGSLRNRHVSSCTSGGWKAKVKALASVGKMIKKVPALASILPLRP